MSNFINEIIRYFADTPLYNDKVVFFYIQQYPWLNEIILWQSMDPMNKLYFFHLLGGQFPFLKPDPICVLENSFINNLNKQHWMSLLLSMNTFIWLVIPYELFDSFLRHSTLGILFGCYFFPLPSFIPSFLGAYDIIGNMLIYKVNILSLIDPTIFLFNSFGVPDISALFLGAFECHILNVFEMNELINIFIQIQESKVINSEQVNILLKYFIKVLEAVNTNNEYLSKISTQWVKYEKCGNDWESIRSLVNEGYKVYWEVID